MSDDGDKPKLIIDSDWKSEAQAEKDRLEAEAEQREAERPQGPGGMPPADFRGLVGVLATQALMYMGAMADPKSGQAVFDPVYSAHMIDLLATLHEKTQGNLSDEEQSELDEVLKELRARYVELSRMVAQQQAAGGAAPGADPMGGGGIISPGM